MTEEMSSPEAGYCFHAFISYRRLSKVAEWVHEFFKDELTTWLREWLEGDEPSLFCDVDVIPTGSNWPRELTDGLRTSCCLVPVWSPAYFASEWCVAELETFLHREEALGARRGVGLIIPAVWHPVPPLRYPRLQHGVATTQVEDFSEFAYTGKGFRDTTRYIEFQEKVRKFAKNVAEAVRRSPDFHPDWPVITPDDVAARDLLRPPSRIMRPILRKSA